jgi:serine/threonine protein kinase
MEWVTSSLSSISINRCFSDTALAALVQIWCGILFHSVEDDTNNNLQMKPGVFREEYIAIIVRELLRGLEYLHSEGKLHRDIKGTFCIIAPLCTMNSELTLTYASCEHSTLCWR